MNVKRFAFPVVVDALNTRNTRMTEITLDRLPRAREALQPRLSSSAGSWLACSETGGLKCVLTVGEHVTLPITIVGSPLDSTGAGGDEDVLVHAPGLAGAFPVSLSELASFRGRIQPCGTRDSTEESTQLGSLCLLESLGKHGVSPNVLDRFYKRARRGSLTCGGLAELLARGDEVNTDGLSLDFPYHCGGVQATKRFLDITEAACTHFSPQGTHGTKVISRYGVAVAVGVAVDSSMRMPCLFWHPSGAPAACLAPVLHGSRLVPVGRTTLAYNGPTSSCEVLQREDPRRYMNLTVEDRYDCTTWLTKGLFGVRPGEPWPRDVAREDGARLVLGVGYDPADEEFELYLQDSRTGQIEPANDV